ncbi:unnamed protein product [Lymnaea stagnalis]|uniref:alkaline phosphatase n=1 Tax=Lymnaea stagnalis TaxID=6523 RepID=A0AAV2I677_LYMST
MAHHKAITCLVILGLSSLAGASFENQDYWKKDGLDDLNSAWELKPNYKVAKNLILMVGDGMGLSTVTAARIYKGQKEGKHGEEYKLAFEQFPYVALSKTYNIDRQVPDSAGTAVAMVTGIKVNYGTVGVTGDVPFGKNCSQLNDAAKLKTVLDFALEEGKSVGLVTTTRITHATPAAAYAHVPFRDWESDFNMVEAPGCSHVKDIAYQLTMDNPNIHVILGGGRRSFINYTTPDPNTGSTNGQRMDGLDLIGEWKKDKQTRGLKHAYVDTRQKLAEVDVSQTDYLFGLFASNHLAYETDRTGDSQEPTLTEMADKAIRILSKNPKGYFLLIEGGRIDHAHHDNYAKRALEEANEFDNSVIKVGQLTSEDDTLTVVTADHSHVFTIAGYPSRGRNILGTVDNSDGGEPVDKMPYLTLGYMNGPRFGRENLTGVDTTHKNFQQPSGVQMPYETHGGEDVIIYAKGPMAHMFHRTHEQSYIGHVLMYSSCLGLYKDKCDLVKRNAMASPCGAGRHAASMFVLVVGVLQLCTRLLF